jgi:hypothetical protein
MHGIKSIVLKQKFPIKAIFPLPPPPVGTHASDNDNGESINVSSHCDIHW